MARKIGILRIDENKFFLALLLSFVAIQLGSWILSSMVPKLPLIKGGWVLFLFLIIITITTLYTLGKNIKDFSFKREGIIILFIFLIVLLLFIFIPKIVPEIFSVGGAQIREFFKENVGAIIRLSPSGIAS